MKSLFNRYVWIVQICLLLLGLLLIVVSNVDSLMQPGGSWSVTLLSVGVTFLTTVLLTIFYTISKTDAASIIEQKLNFQTHVFDLGVEAVHLGVGDESESFFNRFERARYIDMMYNTAKNCSFRYGGKIENAIIAHGCKVRILIANADNKALQDQVIINALCPGTDISSELRDVMGHLQLIKERLERHSPALISGSLEIRKYACVPTNSIVILDNEIARHTPYLPYFHSSEVPIFHVTKERGGKLFMIYQKAFNEVWEHHSTPIWKVDFSENARLSSQSILTMHKNQQVKSSN